MSDPPQDSIPVVHEVPLPEPQNGKGLVSKAKIRNRYLKRIRRPLPDGLAIVLFLIAMAVWFYQNPRHSPQTLEEINQVFPYIERIADRDLLTAKAMEESPKWQWILFGYFSPDDARVNALDRLEKTGDPLEISERLIAMRAVTLLLQNNHDEATELLSTILPERQSALANAWAKGEPATDEDLRFLWERMEAGDTAWWEVELAMHFSAQAEQPLVIEEVIEEHVIHANKLMRVQIAISLFWIVTAVLGVAFLPKFYRAYKNRSTLAQKTYLEGIAASDVIIWFAVSAWIAELLLRLAWSQSALLYETFPEIVEVMLDSAWRLLPVFIMGMWFFSRKRHFIEAMGLRQRVPVGLILAALSISFGWELVTGLLSPYSETHLTEHLEYEGIGWEWFAVSLISSCIMAPICEEIIYRGFLFRGIANRFGVAIGTVASSLIFGAVHYYPLDGFLSVVGMGVVNAWMYHATRSLIGPIVLHAVWNLVVTLNIWGIYLSDPLTW